MQFAVFSQKVKNLKENIFDYYNRNDSTPFFKFEKGELDTLLFLNKQIPKMADMQGVSYYAWMRFTVTRDGKIGTLNQVSGELNAPKNTEIKQGETVEKLKKTYHEELVRLVKLTEPLWYSDSVREKTPIYLKIEFESAAHDMIEVYQNKALAPADYTIKDYQAYLYNFGVKKFGAKKTLLAQVYFEQAIRFNKNDIDAHYNLGNCYFVLKKTKMACGEWSKCVELGDKDALQQVSKFCKE